jgi:hypothetical protein
MLKILLEVANTNQSWIDKYANLNTFIGLIVGIFGLVLSVYFYKKQKRSTNKKQNIDDHPESDIPYLGVSLKVDHVLRKFVSYGASEGEIIQAGNFRANYEVEAELKITIQNESHDTIYGLEVSFVPNESSKNCKLIDSRQNKLEPLEGNNHVDFTLRIINHYYDVYASDVDKDIQKIYKLGKDVSLLNGSKLIIKYKDSKHKEQVKTEVIE